MSPYIYAGKAVMGAVISTVFAAEGLAKLVIFGASLDSIASIAIGMGSLSYIAFRMWRDDRQWKRLEEIHQRERRLAYGEGYVDGREGKDPVEVAHKLREGD